VGKVESSERIDVQRYSLTLASGLLKGPSPDGALSPICPSSLRLLGTMTALYGSIGGARFLKADLERAHGYVQYADIYEKILNSLFQSLYKV
jgi:hypothetical protein